MLTGYLFSVIIASSVINIAIAFTGKNRASNLLNFALIIFLILMIFLLARSRRVTSMLNHVIKAEIEKYIMKNQQFNPLYVLDTYGKLVMCEIFVTDVPEVLNGKTLIEAGIRQKYNVSVLTIKHNSEVRTINATNDLISKNDRIIVFGDLENIKLLFHTDIL